MAGRWRRVKKGAPCAVCGNAGWCGYNDDGFVRCQRTGGSAVPGWKIITKLNEFGLRQDKHGATVYAPEGMDLGTHRRSPEEIARQEAEERKAELWRIGEARKMWARVRGLKGSANHPRMREYFAARGVPLERLPGGVIPDWLRFDPSHGFEWDKPRGKWKLSLPCIVGAMARDEKAEAGGVVSMTTGVQRIFLDPVAPRKYVSADGEPPKKGRGAFSRAVLRLNARDDAQGVLILCEGIETGVGILAACRREDGSYPAVWPCMSTSGLTGFVLPAAAREWVKRIIIAGDLDRTKPNGHTPGRDAAVVCANVLRRELPDVEVLVALPSHDVAPSLVGADGSVSGEAKGADWLDVLVAHGVDAVRAGMMGGEVVSGEKSAAPASEKRSEGSIEDRIYSLIAGETRMERVLQLLLGAFAPAKNARPSSGWHLRHYAGSPWVYVEEKGKPRRWRMEDEQLVVARSVFALDKLQVLTRSGSKPMDPSRDEASTSVLAAMNYTYVAGKKMPCWLPPSFDEVGEPLRESLITWGEGEHEGPIRPESVIAFKNGLLDVDAFVGGRVVMAPHTPRWFSRTCLPFDLPVEQVQAAMADEADEFDLVQALAPTWLGFLDHASQGEGLWVETLQRWFGYCLTSDISLQKMLWLQGYPGTGKGTIREAITTVVGEDNTAMMTIDALAGRFDVASMVGKNAIFIPELRVSHQTNQAAALDLLNSISGGDPQKVDDKFKKIESFVRMTGKFVITPNEESSLTDPSAAMLRRLVVLRMGSPPVKADPTLQARIVAEGVGLAVWSLFGLRRLRLAVAKGEEAFPETEAGRALRGEIKRTMSPVSAFVDDTCLKGGGYEVHTDVLYELFCEWCEEQGMKNAPVKQTFGKQLRAAFFDVDKADAGGRNSRFKRYVGLRPLFEGESRDTPSKTQVCDDITMVRAGRSQQGQMPF